MPETGAAPAELEALLAADPAARAAWAALSEPERRMLAARVAGGAQSRARLARARRVATALRARAGDSAADGT